MKKIGRINFYEDVDLNLKFDFDELCKFHGADEEGIKSKLLDKNGFLKMDFLEELVETYVNAHIKDKFGKSFSLDVMDDTMNITWDIKVKSIKEKASAEWWDKRILDGEYKTDNSELSLDEMLANPDMIPEGHPSHRK